MEKAMDKILYNSINSKDFYEKYVKERKPVQFSNHLSDTTWKAEKWTSQYLKVKLSSTVINNKLKTNNN